MTRSVAVVVSWLLLAMPSFAEQRRQAFDSDPKWDSFNNHTDKIPCRKTSQDFGYSPDTSHAGGERGEIGGAIHMAGDQAYYAVRFAKPLTFTDRLSAAGKVAFPDPKQHGAFLIGFLNSKNSIAWRTRNTLAMRLDHRGDALHAHIEYATDRWRAGGEFIGEIDSSTGKKTLKNLPLGGVHQWSFEYEPEGNKGEGSVALTIDGQRVALNLNPGHKTDGATFDRFGLFNVMKSSDNRVMCYLDDLTINGQTEDFSRDPQWEGVRNHREYNDCLVRPRFDFGFSDTRFAGGAKGELGGIVFRGDDRDRKRTAYCGDRVEMLTLAAPLLASGRVALRRGISDSTSLLGWFNAEESLKPGRSVGLPRHFIGVMVEGPSSEGFFFRSACCTGQDDQAIGSGPIILPDGRPHRWELRFTPKAQSREGTIALSLDGESATLDLKPALGLQTARFNRFGIVTTRVDGNYQFIYYDDLEYTCRQSD